MWILKCSYRHINCKYSSVVERLGLVFCAYPINAYIHDGRRYLTTLHALEGSAKAIGKYGEHVRKFAVRLEYVSENMLFTLTTASSDTEFYEHMYNPMLFYPSPVVHKDGREYAHLACWEREPLSQLLQFLQSHRDFEDVRVELFTEQRIPYMHIWKLFDKLTEKQRLVIELAIRRGYYSYPRQIDLGGIAAELSLSKSSVHETLRRAESNFFKT